MKYFLLTFLVLVSFLANAQFARGDKFIGGTFSFNTQEYAGLNGSDNESRLFGLSPSVGFFLNDKFALGGRVGYTLSYQKSNFDISVQENTSHSVSLGGFVKRYFMISDKFFFTLSGDVGYGREVQKQEYGSTENKTKSNIFGMYIQPSFIFFPTPNWGIEGSIGSLSFYHFRNLSYDSKHNSFSINYGTFSLSFAYYLRKQL